MVCEVCSQRSPLSFVPPGQFTHRAVVSFLRSSLALQKLLRNLE